MSGDFLACDGRHDGEPCSDPRCWQTNPDAWNPALRAPTCRVCDRQKIPRGRAAPDDLAATYCPSTCPGYEAIPKPGVRWPGERTWGTSDPNRARAHECLGAALAVLARLELARLPDEARKFVVQARQRLSIAQTIVGNPEDRR